MAYLACPKVHDIYFIKIGILLFAHVQNINWTYIQTFTPKSGARQYGRTPSVSYSEKALVSFPK